MMESKRREGLISDYEQKREKCQGDDTMLKKIETEHNLELKKWAEWDQKQRLVIESMEQMSK